mgnify:CR=1 FL=1
MKTSSDISAQRPFTLLQRIQLTILPIALADIFYLLYRSCSVETRGREHHDETLKKYGRCHVVIWHECMAMAGCYNRGKDYLTMVSASRDGELATRVITVSSHHLTLTKI